MSDGIRLHVLLTGVQTDRLALAAVAVEAVAVFLYLMGVRRLAARGRDWSASATAAFVTGIACLWIAVGSGLASYDDVNATVHVVQHTLLMMVAAPLIALGRPITLASQAARRPTQVHLLRVVHSRVIADLSHPVAGWLLYYGSMYVCFLDRRFYDFLLIHPLAHDGSHLVLLAIGYLYWQALLGGDPSRRRLSHRTRRASTLIGTAFECVLGVAIMTFRRPLDPINTLSDTHAAGAAFVAFALLSCGLCTAVMVRRSRRQDGRRVARAANGVVSVAPFGR
jgi:cytochrome c oxidase assembly factor CtaG